MPTLIHDLMAELEGEYCSTCGAMLRPPYDVLKEAERIASDLGMSPEAVMREAGLYDGCRELTQRETLEAAAPQLRDACLEALALLSRLTPDLLPEDTAKLVRDALMAALAAGGVALPEASGR